jgi:hypothetical protein
MHLLLSASSIRFVLILMCVYATLGLPRFASAQLVVSEIMYDLQTGADTGREWIEVFNASQDAIPITEWKVLEGGSNHSMTVLQGGDTLPSGGYAIIADNPAKFLVDWPGYAGAVYDTAFSGGLSNSGEAIAVGYVASGSFVATDSVTYTNANGGTGDGMSVHRATSDSASFTGGAPTPGTGALLVIPELHVPSGTAQEQVTEQTATTTTQGNTTSTQGIVSSYVAPPEPLIYAYAGKDRDVIAGADVVYEGQAYDKKGAWLSASTTRFSWNFGDGNVGEGPQILHHFNVPGRYAVVLSVANATNAAAAKIAVNVHPVSIAMSETSGAIVLTNTSGFELDLTDWFFKSGDVLFRLPKNTTLFPHASAAFVASTTGVTDIRSAVLLYPNGTIASAIGSSTPVIPQVIAPQPALSTPRQRIQKSTPAPRSELIEPIVTPEPQTDRHVSTSTALTAAAAASTEVEHVWWIMAAALAVGGGAVASLISRTKKKEWNIEESD